MSVSPVFDLFLTNIRKNIKIKLLSQKRNLMTRRKMEIY
ncbi:hypothetical protein Cst_c06940 [Thermoclostridium stercorarium subsp. stercorarium DSM 8532]|uniref:Uncharacterized protein n=1 Tax=Thermoclostridium stercorarium (strain ATCC 35414 / DSM 8532 / NCIMB 11754) TaxID=1121335 RepID=L7VQ68_THES1|nr:hypothetical protein Cst_c06940 [Thermoclostridium stercorarium subsp. stercorarium DSM 8532]